MLREHRLDPAAVSWLETNFLETELELGHCLRTPSEAPCECDLVLTCSKFLTTSEYAPRLRARLTVVAFWAAAATGARQELIAADPSRFFVPPFGGYDWVGVRLNTETGGPDWDEVREIIIDAYRPVASKALVARLDTGPERRACYP